MSILTGLLSIVGLFIGLPLLLWLLAIGWKSDRMNSSTGRIALILIVGITALVIAWKVIGPTKEMAGLLLGVGVLVALLAIGVYTKNVALMTLGGAPLALGLFLLGGRAPEALEKVQGKMAEVVIDGKPSMKEPTQRVVSPVVEKQELTLDPGACSEPVTVYKGQWIKFGPLNGGVAQYLKGGDWITFTPGQGVGAPRYRVCANSDTPLKTTLEVRTD